MASIGSTAREWTLAEVLADPALFFGFLKIKDTKGVVHPFKLNAEQQEMLEMYKKRDGKNLIILKPRQIGSSTFFAALLFWKWYTSIDPVSIYSVAHTDDSASNFNTMYKTFWDNLPAFLQCRELEKCNTQTLKLKDTGARLEQRTAGAKGGMRSFSCNILHCSEFAFYSDPDEFMATAIPALNDGLLIIESTPNYWGDGFHKRINTADHPDSNMLFKFFAWNEHRSYVIPGVTISLTEEEQELVAKHKLTMFQVNWRRRKIQEVGYAKFRRDYPLTIEDAYSLTGDNWFCDEELSHLDVKWKTEGEEALVLEEPIAREKYAVGSDVAGGVGRDYSVITVVNVKTRNMVYKFASNTIQPSDLAHKLQEVSTRYNNAKILVERNSIGEVIYSEFKHLGVWNYWKDADGNPWLTTAKNKPLILNNLRKVIASQSMNIIDAETLDQMRSIKINSKGSPDFDSRDNINGHYDSLMALALALQCADSIPLADIKTQFSVMLEEFTKQERRNSRTPARIS